MNILSLITLLCLFIGFQGVTADSESLVANKESLRKIKQNRKVSNPCINLAGFEFSGNYPNRGNVDYYWSKGFNTFRFPLKWERLQTSVNTRFEGGYYGAYKSITDYVLSKGGTVIIDVHNYARYNGQQLKYSGYPSIENFKDLWRRIASVPGWKNNNRVWFCLMNEPYGFKDTYLVKNIMQAGIDAVRSKGATNWVIVNGNGYSGSYSWVNNNWYGTANAVAFTGLKDRYNKIIVDVHSYLDADNSGNGNNCANTNIGPQRMGAFMSWVRKNRYKAQIGETGCGTAGNCLTALGTQLNYINANSDVVISWCWWAGGPAWDRNYISLLDPEGGRDKPQMGVIQRYIR